MKSLAKTDPKILKSIQAEEKRQRDYLALIPSENYASKAVREAVGSVMMNKYSEGQAKRRYYQGNKYVDEVELECKKRALATFGLSGDNWGVNVQAHSGSPANLAVYVGLLEPGDKIMGMYLPDGGHLSHGWQLPDRKISFVSKVWDIGFYYVDKKTQVFDYDQIEMQAKKFKPKMLISGGTAYPREINHRRMGMIAQKVGAYYMADIAHEAGLVAAGANKPPFRWADIVTMTTHKTLRGPRGALIFSRKELSGKIDFGVFPGLQGGPHNHTIAGIAVSLKEAQTAKFKRYSEQIVKNARVLAEEFKKADYDVVSGGTDKHLVLLDLRRQDLSGWVVAWALEHAGIVANRNTVPSETASPYFPSGLRMGTPAVTSRGMKEKEMKRIARWIKGVTEHVAEDKLPDDKEKRKVFTKKFLQKISKDKYLARVRREVRSFARKFPVPGLDS